MIEIGEDQFPNNVASILETRFSFIDDDLFVVKRPLRSTDPNQSIGIVAQQWMPDIESFEMRGIPNNGPTLSRYLITIQAYVKHMDEVQGLNIHGVLAREIRSILYNDAPLRDALSSLSSTLQGKVETPKRWGVQQQRFFSNELDSSWLYLSILEFWLETETR